MYVSKLSLQSLFLVDAAVAANDATVAAACNDDDEMMGEWNPMRSEFLADENCYHVDNEDPAVQSTNYSKYRTH